MQTITSVKNPAVQDARALQTVKGRREQNAFLLDGEHMVSEGLRCCPDRIRAFFAEEGIGLDAWLPLLPEGVPVYSVPARVMEAVSQVKTPQGVAAVCAMPAEVPLRALGEKLVLLENVQDPGNVGTILRTADAAGFDGIILTPGCADLYGGKVLRATMGSVFRVPVCFAASAAEAGRVLAETGYAVIGAELHGEDFYRRETLPSRLCVMIGNEGAGLTDEALAACTHRFRLPMRGGAESLNAAIAAAVFMYDLRNR